MPCPGARAGKAAAPSGPGLPARDASGPGESNRVAQSPSRVRAGGGPLPPAALPAVATTARVPAPGRSASCPVSSGLWLGPRPGSAAPRCSRRAQTCASASPLAAAAAAAAAASACAAAARAPRRLTSRSASPRLLSAASARCAAAAARASASSRHACGPAGCRALGGLLHAAACQPDRRAV